MNKPPITTKGALKLKEKLKHLKQVERPKITQAIAEARAHGDLSENAEYKAAKEQQSFIEGRIAELESTLTGTQIINVSTINVGDKVAFGATVEMIRLTDNQKFSYQIVGEKEADIEDNLISIMSPIARALIGKKTGDIATVKAPGGKIEYEITQIDYIS